MNHYHAQRYQGIQTYHDLFFFVGLPDPSFLATDIEEVIRAGNSIQGVAHSKWLFITPRFRLWMQKIGQSSDIILVNGNLGGMTTGKISALSVLTALFSRIQKTPDMIILYHFCCLHSQHGDPIVGPRGLLQSLIAQLLIYLHQHHKTPARFSVMNNIFLHDVARRDLLALCLFLSQLLEQMERNTTVYCVIDAISEFETSLDGWNNEIAEIVTYFQDLVHNRSNGPVLKFLLIAPHRSIQIYDQIRPDDQIWLNSGNLLSDSVQQPAFDHDFQRAMQLERD